MLVVLSSSSALIYHWLLDWFFTCMHTFFGIILNGLILPSRLWATHCKCLKSDSCSYCEYYRFLDITWKIWTYYVNCTVMWSSFLTIFCCLIVFQLIRIHSRNSQLGWTRQKVSDMLHRIILPTSKGLSLYVCIHMTK